MPSNAPAPGSEDAINQGCLCPQLDNRRGRGAYEGSDGKPVFWITEGCPLHAQ